MIFPFIQCNDNFLLHVWKTKEVKRLMNELHEFWYRGWSGKYFGTTRPQNKFVSESSYLSSFDHIYSKNGWFTFQIWWWFSFPDIHPFSWFSYLQISSQIGWFTSHLWCDIFSGNLSGFRIFSDYPILFRIFPDFPGFFLIFTEFS